MPRRDDAASAARVVPASVAGPAERALAQRIRAEVGVTADVERSAPSAPAEFRVDARAFGGEGTPEDTRGLAKTLGDLPGIEKAVAIPPRVYLGVELGRVREAVVEAVEAERDRYGWTRAAGGAPIVFSIGCPNANKPLHVGHLRNLFLGTAVSRLFETQGYRVTRTEELANFGIHVCQALVAYERWGEGATPDTTARKGDHFVGDHYARFHAERRALGGDVPEVVTELDEAASELLRRQYAGSPEDVALNERVTEWAIAGIRETYARVGMRHDFVLRELETLPSAMELIERGLETGVCLRRADGSVYVDLRDLDLGEVTLLRRDGTPLSLVFFVAIWVRRWELHPEPVVRITGEQWREGFTQFLEVMRRLGRPEVSDATDGIWYGMIRSPEGKIRSRTGNEVSADDLVDHFRDRFVSDWGGGVQPYHREAAEMLSVALLKLFILGKKREDTIVYESQAAWDATVPRMARLAAALRLAEEPRPGAREPGGSAARRVVSDLVLALNALPYVFARAAGRYDAADVVAHADTVARRALDCDRRGLLDPALARAVGGVLRNALWALDVSLPSSLRELPPSLR